MLSAMVKLPAENPTAGDSSCGGSQEGSSEPKKLALNSGEQLYAELRDKNFSAIGALLSRKAKLISAQFDVSAFLSFQSWPWLPIITDFT